MSAAKKSRRIVSWNVTGLRACAKKGFARWLSRSGAEIVGLQEVRAFPDQLPGNLRAPRNWHACYQPAERPGYSGVGLLSRRPPDRVDSSLGQPRFDVEGRLQIARFGRLVVVNAYFPKGSGRERDNSRVPYKLDFYHALFDRVQRLRRGGLRVLVMGDWNTAHREIDLARPRENTRNSGFLQNTHCPMSTAPYSDLKVRSVSSGQHARMHPAPATAVCMRSLHHPSWHLLAQRPVFWAYCRE